MGIIWRQILTLTNSLIFRIVTTFNNNDKFLKTYPGLSHFYGRGIEILTIGNGEALKLTLDQNTTKN